MSGINEQFKSAGKNLSQLLTKTTQIFNDRWEELTAIQERRREVFDLAKERQRLMGEMGAKVYSLHRRGKVQNRDLLSDCERIDTIGQDIARMEREIEELKRSRSQSEAPMADITDDSPVVAEEDSDTGAAEPEAARTIPVETEEEAGSAPEPKPIVPEFRPEPMGDPGEPEVRKADVPPCSHAQDAAEGPPDGSKPGIPPGCEGPDHESSGQAPVNDAAEPAEPDVKPVVPEFRPEPMGDPVEPEVRHEDHPQDSHAQEPVEGPLAEDEEDDETLRPGDED